MRTRANPRSRRKPREMCTHLKQIWPGHTAAVWLDRPIIRHYTVESLSFFFILYAVSPPTSLPPRRGMYGGGWLLLLLTDGKLCRRSYLNISRGWIEGRSGITSREYLFIYYFVAALKGVAISKPCLIAITGNESNSQQPPIACKGVGR